MHRQHTQGYYTREQYFNDKFPLSIVAVLAIIQMLTTFAIVALEIGHVIINVKITNLFAGFWTSAPFTILWISMFATVCCCRRRGCATHAVVQTCISLIFAAILIGINIAFLYRPYHCFFTQKICENLNWVNDLTLPFDCFDGNTNNCDNTRLALIKAQLAGAALIVITCLIYLILYTIVASRARKAYRDQPIIDTMAIPTAPMNYPVQLQQNPPYLYQSNAPMVPSNYQPGVIPSNYPNYIPPNPYPTLYPNMINDRF